MDPETPPDKFVMPEWMEKYRRLIKNDDYVIENMMVDRTSVKEDPRKAFLATSIKAQVRLLERLRAAGVIETGGGT